MSYSIMSPVSSSSASDDGVEGPCFFFSHTTLEVRKMIYTELAGDKVDYDLKEGEEADENDDHDRHSGAGMCAVNKKVREEYRPIYMRQFTASAALGGPEDIINFDFEGDETHLWAFRSNLTHVWQVTLEYDTGHRPLEDRGRVIANGQITVTILDSDKTGPGFKVTGHTEVEGRDGEIESYENKEWGLIREIEESMIDWLAEDKLGLISLECMEDLNQQLVDDVEEFKSNPRCKQAQEDYDNYSGGEEDSDGGEQSGTEQSEEDEEDESQNDSEYEVEEDEEE